MSTSTSTLPHFVITNYPSSIDVEANKQFTVDVTVENDGSADGDVEVRLVDHNNNIVDSKTVTISAGSSQSVTLTGTAPSTAGTYTWKVEAYNVSTESVDDSKDITLNVTAPPSGGGAITPRTHGTWLVGPQGILETLVAYYKGIDAYTLSIKLIDQNNNIIGNADIDVSAQSKFVEESYRKKIDVIVDNLPKTNVSMLGASKYTIDPLSEVQIYSGSPTTHIIIFCRKVDLTIDIYVAGSLKGSILIEQTVYGSEFYVVLPKTAGEVTEYSFTVKAKAGEEAGEAYIKDVDVSVETTNITLELKELGSAGEELTSGTLLLSMGQILIAASTATVVAIGL